MPMTRSADHIVYKLRDLKVGQSKFVSGSSQMVNSILEAVRKLGRNVSFRTEAREGGRLVTRVE